jgi:hypothetical protein
MANRELVWGPDTNFSDQNHVSGPPWVPLVEVGPTAGMTGRAGPGRGSPRVPGPSRSQLGMGIGAG